MRWTLGLLLLGAVGCGYHQTKMVACADTRCPPPYSSSSSPQGLPAPRAERPAPIEPVVKAPPITPLPDEAPPPPEPPVPSP
jgi:hypothetical protein